MAEWTVWDPYDTHPDDPDFAWSGPRQIKATSVEEAAKTFAELECKDDCECYEDYLGSGLTLCVRGASGLVHRVHVQGTQDVTFTSRRVE